jgi:alkaline phosphatase D
VDLLTTSRRNFLQCSAAFIVTASTSFARASDTTFHFDPFTLGVASGYPTADGMVLWTRLLNPSPDVHSPIEGTIPVKWEIAADEKMRKIVRSGIDYATSEFAHSIHVEASGLKPDRLYWYRFTAGGMRSPIGRTRTAPRVNAKVKTLRVGVASCQKYENGYFVAYRHMVAEDLDLLVHTGDYIYEYASIAGGNNMRGDGSPEIRTLDQYRARYALYKSDPDLRAAHAACPWLVTWDDHEVANDYFGAASYEQSGEEFLLRRAAAYRAYYEHMPLPRSALPVGPHMQLHARRQFGDLLNVVVMDSRQHRSPIACTGSEDDGGAGARCASLFNATRTKLGEQQERWLHEGLSRQTARWNIFAQGTPMAHVDLDSGSGVAYRRDSWDGYPAARQRFLDAIANAKTSNPIVVDGDIHAFQVANLNAKANDPTSPVIASEFTTDSITSFGISQTRLDQNRQMNPNLLFSDSRLRGYLRLDFAKESVRADLINVSSITKQDATRSVLTSFAVADGKPGPQKI